MKYVYQKFPAVKITMAIRLWFAIFLACFSLSGNAVTFLDIWEYRVDGNSLLTPEKIQRTLHRYLGAARTLDDVEAAAKALQELYKAEGYPAVYVEIPPQTVVGGVFKLAVTETKLRRLKVSGATYFLPSLIRRSMPSLEKGRPLSLAGLQEDIRHANAANKDLKVVPMVKQGPTPDTLDVELDIDDQFPLFGAVELNNYYTESTSPSRLSVELGYGNLWQKHHTFSIQAQTTPENQDEVKVFAASYLAPVGLKGKKLAFYSIVSDSDIVTLADTRVVGDGFILGGRFIWPFKQDGREYNTLILGADYKDFDELIDLEGDSDRETPIEYMSFTAQLNQINGGPRWRHNIGLAITFGVRGLFNENAEFDEKQSLGEPNFFRLKLDYDRSHRFDQGWVIENKLYAQLSDSPLASNEQTSAGGVETVRGYFESQISADRGLGLSLQANSPSVFASKFDWLNKLHYYGFLEGAHLTNADSGIAGENEFGIAAVGIGTKGQIYNSLSFQLDLGYPLVEEGTVDEGEVQLRGNLRYEF